MAEESKTGAGTNTRQEGEMTFKCKFCGESRPLSELVSMRRFFPPVTACAACEKTLDRNIRPEARPEAARIFTKTG